MYQSLYSVHVIYFTYQQVVISYFIAIPNAREYKNLMGDRNKTLATVASIVGIGLCCVLLKYRSKLYRQLRLLTDFRNPLRYQNVKIVNNAEECRQVLGNLKL